MHFLASTRGGVELRTALQAVDGISRTRAHYRGALPAATRDSSASKKVGYTPKQSQAATIFCYLHGDDQSLQKNIAQ